MSENLAENDKLVSEQINVTAEAIKQVTNFELVLLFPGFHQDDGYVSPDVHECRERLTSEYGEDNVLTSFVLEDDQIKLGLFVRPVN